MVEKVVCWMCLKLWFHTSQTLVLCCISEWWFRWNYRCSYGCNCSNSRWEYGLDEVIDSNGCVSRWKVDINKGDNEL